LPITDSGTRYSEPV